MNKRNLTIVITPTTEIMDVARIAAENNLMLISNGKNTLVSATLLRGYNKVFGSKSQVQA